MCVVCVCALQPSVWMCNHGYVWVCCVCISYECVFRSTNLRIMRDTVCVFLYHHQCGHRSSTTHHTALFHSSSASPWLSNTWGPRTVCSVNWRQWRHWEVPLSSALTRQGHSRRTRWQSVSEILTYPFWKCTFLGRKSIYYGQCVSMCLWTEYGQYVYIDSVPVVNILQ